MKQFLALNRHKLLFVCFRIVLLTCLIVLLFQAAGCLGGHPFQIKGFLFSMVIGFALSIFLAMISIWSWFWKRAKRKEIFALAPFNSLADIGFTPYLKNESNNWCFTEEVKIGKHKGFNIKCDLSANKTNILEFEAYTERRRVEYDRISERFKQYNIEFGFGSRIKHYHLKRHNLHSITVLQRDLDEFIELLRQEGLEPGYQLD